MLMKPMGDKQFNVTLMPPNKPPRSFLGDMYHRTWDNTEENCLYVGNGQGGHDGHRELRGSVIEGRYTDYIMEGIFDTNFKFNMMRGKCTA